MGRTVETVMEFEDLPHKRAMVKLAKDQLDISKMNTGAVMVYVVRRHAGILISLVLGLTIGFIVGVGA